MQSLLCEDGWTGICANRRHSDHARKLMRDGIGDYSREAALMVKYLGEFVTLTCAPDMLTLRLFPNGKEISESFGAYDAVRYRLPQFDLKDRGVTVIVVGDGNTPRTGATFAMRSAWTVHSVDPKLKGGSRRWSGIKRLSVHKKTIEQFSIECERAIIVAVHSHAHLPNAVAAVRAPEIAVVAMPCCVPQRLSTEPDREYDERAVISPCRRIRIWNNVATDGSRP